MMDDPSTLFLLKSFPILPNILRVTGVVQPEPQELRSWQLISFEYRNAVVRNLLQRLLLFPSRNDIYHLFFLIVEGVDQNIQYYTLELLIIKSLQLHVRRKYY